MLRAKADEADGLPARRQKSLIQTPSFLKVVRTPMPLPEVPVKIHLAEEGASPEVTDLLPTRARARPRPRISSGEAEI